MFNESTDIDIASSIGEASRMVVVDEELARVAELPVIPETESYVPGKMQSWATRDVANKKAELADEEREVAEEKASELSSDKLRLEKFTKKTLKSVQQRYKEALAGHKSLVANINSSHRNEVQRLTAEVQRLKAEREPGHSVSDWASRFLGW